MFAGCINLTTVPINLLKECNELVSLGKSYSDNKLPKYVGMFEGCSKLTLKLRFDSPNITDAANLAKGTVAKGTAYVKANSTTANTFKNDGTANMNVVPEV